MIALRVIESPSNEGEGFFSKLRPEGEEVTMVNA